MRTTPRLATEDFAAQTAAVQRVLVVEVAGLGDLVHSLPAMWAIRQSYPAAELHCLVREEYSSLLDFVPWVDRVWPYRRGRIRDLGSAVAMALRLRQERFDIAFDLMGSDHASVAAWASGAARRLVRRPGRKRMRIAWRFLATDLVEHPFGQEQMYRQRLLALRGAGVGTLDAGFEFDRRPAFAFDPGADDGPPLVHVSPYTKRSQKELPQVQLVELLERLRAAVPGIRLVISCAGKARELQALERLIRALPFAPWRVCPGSLDMPGLYALIESAPLHLSGDTGSMHLARLAGTPSVTWMSALASHRSWAPEGDRHGVVYSTVPPETYLLGVSTDAILEMSTDRLRSPSGAGDRRERSGPARQGRQSGT